MTCAPPYTPRVEKAGYWTRIWKARVGWHATYTYYGDGDGRMIGVGPSVPTWRPTREWALRVVTRRIERMKRQDARKAAAQVAKV